MEKYTLILILALTLALAHAESFADKTTIVSGLYVMPG